MKPILTALALLGSLTSGQWLEGIVELPVAGTDIAVYNPASNQVYVGGSGQSWLAALDGTDGGHRAFIRTGGTIRALAVDSTANRVYCAVPQRLAIIDCVTNRVIHNISMTSALVLCLNEPSRKLYCACGSDVVVVEVDAGSIVRTIPIGRPAVSFCFNLSEHKLYCAGDRDSAITVIDTGADSILCQVPVDGRVRSMVLNPVNNHVYCADWWNNRLLALDCAVDTFVATVPVGLDPRVLCVNTTDNKVYCANYSSGTVSVVDATADSLLATHSIGNQPSGLTWDRVNDRVFCVAYASAHMTAIDGLTDTVVGQVHVARSCGTACAGPTGILFVPNNDAKVVSVVYGRSLTRTAVIALSGRSQLLACNPGTDKCYCVGTQEYGESYSYPLCILDGVSLQVSGIQAVGSYPRCIDYSSKSGKLYVGRGTGGVHVFDGVSDSCLTRISLHGEVKVLEASPLTKNIYCAARDLNVIDGSCDTLLSTINTGYEPRALCLAPEASKLYVGGWSDHRLTAVSCSSLQVVGQIDIVGRDVTVLAYASVPSYIYCHSHESYDGWTSPIDCTTDSVLLDLPVWGQVLCYNWREDKVYCFHNVHDGIVKILNGTTSELLAELPVGRYPTTAYYNSVNNKVYCATLQGIVTIIDGAGDYLLDAINIGYELKGMAWDSVSNRTFVGSNLTPTVAVLRDIPPAAIAEPGVGPRALPTLPTISTGSVYWPHTEPGELLDVAGRRVTELKQGPNDLAHIRVGVYFIRQAGCASSKLVVQH